MHIPDGVLSTGVWLSLWVASVGIISFCIKKITQILKDKMVPLMGIMAAFIFAAQMLNFPVSGGTSGHLIGGVLAAVALGPLAGPIVITVVLIVQALIFQDGGITALGANIFNMAVIGSMFGYLIYNLIRRTVKGNTGILIGCVIASWLSVVVASFACALELGLSKKFFELSVTIPAMVGIHSLIGIGEAIITFLVVSFILKVRPDLIYNK